MAGPRSHLNIKEHVKLDIISSEPKHSRHATYDLMRPD